MAEFPAMPFWTDAYLGDTMHLTCTEHGAYFLLLVTAWRSKSHCLPDDDILLAQFCRLRPQQWRRVRPRLEPYFEINNGFWFSNRLLDELEYLKRLKARRSTSGIIGALSRWHRGTTHGTQHALPRAQQRGSRAHGEQSKLLKTHDADIANACDDDGKAMAPTPTKIREEGTTEKEPKKANGNPVVTEHLLRHIKQKGWIL